jgi:hypothetical protein
MLQLSFLSFSSELSCFSMPIRIGDDHAGGEGEPVLCIVTMNT